jgi:hypothetical protein
MQSSSTDNSNSPATLGSGLPGGPAENMKSHLVPATPEAKTGAPQVPAPVAKNVDSLTLEGSHAGDTRGQAAQPDPLAGNDNPVRNETGTRGA